jgi:hypothetical protein
MRSGCPGKDTVPLIRIGRRLWRVHHRSHVLMTNTYIAETNIDDQNNIAWLSRESK